MSKVDTLAQIKAMNEVFSFQELEGRVFMPGSEQYENSVATSNLLYRFSKPYCVFLPQNVGDVERFVREAAISATKFNIVIKSGGHCYAGFSTAYTGVLLDLARMTRVDFDPPEGKPRPKPKSEPEATSKTVAVGGGAQWGHVYKALVNSRQDGLMVNGGRCPTVGVSGFVLGGGLGPFTRSLGLGCDALLEATIVTADRGTVTVKRPATGTKQTEEEDKLFWALCGAGGGNFGVVVELKLEVQHVQPTLVAGRFTWVTKLDSTFMATMNNFYLHKWPDNATIDSTWLCDIKPRDDPDDIGIAVRFTVAYDGSKDDFNKLIDGFSESGDQPEKQVELASKLKKRACAEPSTLFLHESLVAQWSEETERALPFSNSSYSVYSSFVFGLSGDIEKDTTTIKKITTTIQTWVGKFRNRFAKEQAGLHVTWIHSGGKAMKSNTGASPWRGGAFPWRGGTYFTYITVEWQDKWLSHDAETFLEEFKTALRLYSLKGEAAYVNFPDRKLTNSASGKAYYGENYSTLQGVKECWDSKGLFRSPQGVEVPNSGSNVGEELFDLAGHAGRLWAGPKWEPLPSREEPVGIIRDLADLGF